MTDEVFAEDIKMVEKDLTKLMRCQNQHFLTIY
jgi:hypothetical protein